MPWTQSEPQLPSCIEFSASLGGCTCSCNDYRLLDFATKNTIISGLAVPHREPCSRVCTSNNLMIRRGSTCGSPEFNVCALEHWKSFAGGLASAHEMMQVCVVCSWKIEFVTPLRLRPPQPQFLRCRVRPTRMLYLLYW